MGIFERTTIIIIINPLQFTYFFTIITTITRNTLTNVTSICIKTCPMIQTRISITFIYIFITIITSVPSMRTITSVIIRSVYAQSMVLARNRIALVYVSFASRAYKTWRTGTFYFSRILWYIAGTAILTWIGCTQRMDF